MSFGKGFGIGFVVFVALNLVFSILVGFLAGGNIAAIFTDVSSIIVTLLGGGLIPPTVSFLSIAVSFVGAIDIIALIPLLAAIIIPLISAIIAGKLAGGKGAAFGAWFLISIISAAVLGVLVLLNIIAEIPISLSGYSSDAMTTLILVIVLGAINGIFYGAFAILMSSDDLY